MPGLVRRVRGRNADAIEELYVLIQGIARPHLLRGGGFKGTSTTACMKRF